MEFVAAEGDKDKRLDHFVFEQGVGISRTQIQKLIKEEKILVNAKKAKVAHPLRVGDQITVEIPPPASIDVKPEEIPFGILYEDEDLLVVNKPRGMVTHPAVGHYTGTLVNALLAHCKDLSGIGGELKPGIVHRLDKDTSGIMLVAKNDFTHQALADDLKERTMEKKYIALVHGRVPQEEGIIETKYGRHPTQRQKMAVLTDKHIKESTVVRDAITHYRVLERFNEYTLLELLLKTGRTHQIRVHLAHLGHPVVGDFVYGRKKNDFKIEGQLLHSASIKFIHPRTGKELALEAPLPELMAGIIKKLEKA
ncbi:MAG: RluA family pseudouridine synthase [Candidatus Saganbacteria bacterium]|nr:RluA family pseudouridine synthase [Candidatus Saganbacteria bacterium]